MIAIAFLVSLVAVVLLVLFIIWLSTRLLGRMAGGKHAVAEEVLATGCVPVEWLVDFRGSKPRVRRSMNKRKAVAGLRKVLRYYRSTPLVQDEQTRSRILAGLRAVLARWKTSSWSQMLPPNMPL